MHILLRVVLFTSYAFGQQPTGAPMAEHVVIIDKTQDTVPSIADVLQRVGLHDGHPWVRQIFNNSAFTGFSARMPPCHASDLNNMTDVSLVEKSTSVLHTGVLKTARHSPHERINAPWGLEKLSNLFFHRTDLQAMDYTYSFANEDLGEGVDIYVIDSGIWTEHEGFEGRASMLWAFDGNMTDTDGHGTHVAGTAGAIDFGVASNANIFGVRVLDDKGRGSTATVIAGIDYVVQQHDQRKRENPNFVGSVISISLAADGKVAALDQAIQAAVNAGIHACVAAGNDNEDACNGSPSSSGGKGPAITVGSIDIDSKKSSFSNYGDCVDVYAPGQQILSAGMHDPALLVFLTGTSQATPHVTGLVAYAMANRTLANNPALMKEWVKSTAFATKDGLLMASNGASGNTADGMLGLSKRVLRWTVDPPSEPLISTRSGRRSIPP